MFQTILNSIQETLYLVMSASLLSISAALPCAIMISMHNQQHNVVFKHLARASELFLRLIQAIPFLLILVMFIPLTNHLVMNGASYMNATIVPLALIGFFYLLQRVNQDIVQQQQRWRKTAKIFGASKLQLFRLIIWPDVRAQIVLACSDTVVILIGCATVAGALGAGGLGQLAIESSIGQPQPYLVIASILSVVALQVIFRYTGRMTARVLTVQNIA